MASNKIKRATVWLLRCLGGAALLGSAMTITDSNEWWVRVWDFPRLQIMIAMIIIAGVLIALEKRHMLWLPAFLALCVVWQFYRVFPYTPLAAPEVANADQQTLDEGDCFTAMSYNVQLTNRDYAKSVALIEREKPDILLLLEPDEAWIEALKPVLSTYPSRLDRPLDNSYGLVFASRLPTKDASIQNLVEPGTPSVMATLGDENPFLLIGLHPRPPRPDQDTEERDAELIIAARHAQDQSLPVLAIGDFNDVAWSDTSSTFARLGGFLDPRIGRGPYPTFPAGHTWLGWPLDHIFMTPHFALDTIRVLEETGSDHRPIMARLCLLSQQRPVPNEGPAPMKSTDRISAENTIEDYREDATDDALRSE